MKARKHPSRTVSEIFARHTVSTNPVVCWPLPSLLPSILLEPVAVVKSNRRRLPSLPADFTQACDLFDMYSRYLCHRRDTFLEREGESPVTVHLSVKSPIARFAKIVYFAARRRDSIVPQKHGTSTVFQRGSAKRREREREREREGGRERSASRKGRRQSAVRMTFGFRRPHHMRGRSKLGMRPKSVVGKKGGGKGRWKTGARGAARFVLSARSCMEKRNCVNPVFFFFLSFFLLLSPFFCSCLATLRELHPRSLSSSLYYYYYFVYAVSRNVSKRLLFRNWMIVYPRTDKLNKHSCTIKRRHSRFALR